MYLPCSIGCWLLYEGREDWPRKSELFGIKGICSWLLKVSSTLSQEQMPLIPNNEARTLLTLIGASTFAFSEYPHKPFIFWN